MLQLDARHHVCSILSLTQFFSGFDVTQSAIRNDQTVGVSIPADVLILGRVIE